MSFVTSTSSFEGNSIGDILSRSMPGGMWSLRTTLLEHHITLSINSLGSVAYMVIVWWTLWFLMAHNKPGDNCNTTLLTCEQQTQSDCFHPWSGPWSLLLCQRILPIRWAWTKCDQQCLNQIALILHLNNDLTPCAGASCHPMGMHKIWPAMLGCACFVNNELHKEWFSLLFFIHEHNRALQFCIQTSLLLGLTL